jgi:hypothetical protein
MAALLAVVFVVGLATAPALRAFEASGAPVRVAVAAALVSAAGLFMGAALPLGLRTATTSAPGLVPWLWGVNGATSVFGSVLAAAIALAFGISASYWGGVACYAVAAVALALTGMRGTGPEPLPGKTDLARPAALAPAHAFASTKAAPECAAAPSEPAIAR